MNRLSPKLSVVLSPESLLRLSLGIVYIWFGALKLAGLSPAVEVVRQAYPFLVSVPLFLALSVFELALGAALLTGIWKAWAAAATILHLIGTFGVLIASPQTAFLPQFPFLTMEGEFVVKNIVLLAAAIALFIEAKREQANQDIGRIRIVMAVAVVIAGVGLGLAGGSFHQLLRTRALSSVSADRAETHMKAGAVADLVGAAELMVVEGVIVDRCHALGCWLKLRDETGEVFIDLASSGLNARGIPVGAPVRVKGTLGKTREGSVGFVASALEHTTVAQTP